MYQLENRGVNASVNIKLVFHLIGTKSPEERRERYWSDEGEGEPRVENVGEEGEDHEGDGEKQADHHPGEGAVTGSHDF